MPRTRKNKVLAADTPVVEKKVEALATEPVVGMNNAIKHPLFQLQDQYVLTPETLTKAQKDAIAAHLKLCPFCTRMQTLLCRDQSILILWNNPGIWDEKESLAKKEGLHKLHKLDTKAR